MNTEIGSERRVRIAINVAAGIAGVLAVLVMLWLRMMAYTSAAQASVRGAYLPLIVFAVSCVLSIALSHGGSARRNLMVALLPAYVVVALVALFSLRALLTAAP